MTNTSILAAFERMWFHVVAALSNKSDVSHTHNDIYYTESEIDSKFATHKHDALYDVKGSADTALESAKFYTDTVANGKSDKTHNHDSAYDTKGSASSSLTEAKAYTDTKTANLISTSSVDTKISTHNTSTSAHNDIRDLITGLTTRLNALADSDDTTLDQMSEVVAYIKNNKNLIDGITTNKVNVADIIDNLDTNVANKPLSAAQGVVIKSSLDGLTEEVGKKANASDFNSHIGNKNNPHGVTLTQLDVTATASELNVLDGITATTTELNYVDGVTSNIQTQLNGKAASSHGNHVPTTESANNARFLRNDNTWQTITPANIGAPTVEEMNAAIASAIEIAFASIVRAEGVSF